MTEPPTKAADYAAGDLEEIAKRAEDYWATGFLVPPSSIDLYVVAIKALARERKR
ncbi:hypothetical protein [Methylobacterium gnaphalii]|uniref:Uncharacterized protein n=1 Tax=Methylobacterium gnaphalii TaxID=1010610 RepID=A0A512JRB6_9HYPH|nr:hypothetical protein [Methylobacterium gnaphalii]GEP12496.1 hypothetical protein MGN01_43410 [Methylobacterium gnaphalii]GJD70472.1 hypothetical protein MMMDOFMJ_3421 [Methylobacterium gnaphalii]GLS51457.1 hypothetical protein GCM10007885_43140 [Methylobacterium gnaphalii]